MKNTILKYGLLSLLFLSINVLMAQDIDEPTMSASKIPANEVPAETKTAFSEMYPDAEVDTWWLIEKNYQAQFMNNGRVNKVLLNSAGGLIESRKQLDWEDEAPDAIKSGFNRTEYKYWDVTDFYVTENTSSDKFYEIQVQKGNRFQMIYFKPDGALSEKSLSTF